MSCKRVDTARCPIGITTITMAITSATRESGSYMVTWFQVKHESRCAAFKILCNGDSVNTLEDRGEHSVAVV